MKKLFRSIILTIALLISINETSAYFNTNTNYINIFTTEDYVFKLNANGGYFSNKDISVINNTTVLPTPERTGYTFLGFSKSANGNTNYSVNIDNVDLINNKVIYAKWEIVNYTISYNLNGGSISGEKTSYNVEDNFSLPTPTKVGYIFTGWTGTSLSTTTKTVKIQNSTGNRSYTANWSIESYLVDVNSIIDSITYNSGLSGYTFDVYVDSVIVADDVIDWSQYLNYGTTVRVVTNNKTGHTSNYDETFTITKATSINPTWSRNTYSSHFYVGGNFWTSTNNLYGDYVSTPTVSNVSQFGYDDNFYYCSGFTPWTSWYQQEYTIGFTVNIDERSCRATFGTLSTSNATAQQTKFHNAGYSYCNVNSSNTNEVECKGTYSQVLAAYNAAWNGVLPTSGSGFSRYRDMACDSGWTTYSNR